MDSSNRQILQQVWSWFGKRPQERTLTNEEAIDVIELSLGSIKPYLKYLTPATIGDLLEAQGFSDSDLLDGTQLVPPLDKRTRIVELMYCSTDALPNEDISRPDMCFKKICEYLFLTRVGELGICRATHIDRDERVYGATIDSLRIALVPEDEWLSAYYPYSPDPSLAGFILKNIIRILNSDIKDYEDRLLRLKQVHQKLVEADLRIPI